MVASMSAMTSPFGLRALRAAVVETQAHRAGFQVATADDQFVHDRLGVALKFLAGFVATQSLSHLGQGLVWLKLPVFNSLPL
jgi:hypothetical protein